jgi:hypothetical protein
MRWIEHIQIDRGGFNPRNKLKDRGEIRPLAEKHQDVGRTYAEVGCVIGGGFNPAVPPNNSLKATCSRRDSQPFLAGEVVV